MNNQPPLFCTSCGHPLPGAVAFCPHCGAPPGLPSVGAPGVPYGPPIPSGPPTPALLAGSASANARERRLRRRARAQRPHSRLRGCGCLSLVLAVLAGPFVGAALTRGQVHVVLVYVAVGVVGLVVIAALFALLTSRRGREAAGEIAAEGCAEGCLEALTGGLFGG